MKYIVATLVLLLVGISFAAGVKHSNGELVPAVEAKIKYFFARLFGKKAAPAPVVVDTAEPAPAAPVVSDVIAPVAPSAPIPPAA